MSDYHEQQLNKHMYQLDEDSARDEAIELLAEQLIETATKVAREVITASNYDLSLMDTMSAMDKTEFTEVYYQLAEKLIDTSEGR